MAGESVGLQGSFVMQKSGPLPNWAWMGLGLGAALAYAAWKSNKAKAEKAVQSAAPVGPNGADSRRMGSAYGITYAFVDADSTVNTQYAYPPGGGRPPGGPPKPPDPTPAPDGQWVDIVKWTRHNAPWNSMVSGIAAKIYGDENAWRRIWYAPQNDALRKLRKGDPEEIQPGDKIWVPGAAPGQGQDSPGPGGGYGHGNSHDDDDDHGSHGGGNHHGGGRGRGKGRR